MVKGRVVMCTSFTLTTDTMNYLARTMDFTFPLEGRPVVIPRNYQYQTQLKETLSFPYGFVGTGRNLGQYLFADGVNEKGLVVAELYFPEEADYLTQKSGEKLALAPHELIMWILGNIATIAELEKRIHEVEVITLPNELLGIVLPLHFILTDTTGRTVVIETHDQRLTMKETPANVMTNSPRLEWQLTNLKNYLFLQPNNYPNKKFGDLPVQRFGQGSGTYGLPGGYTSPERFVRTAYLREYIKTPNDASEALAAVFHILNNVTIPRGVNQKEEGADDYTQYRAAFDAINKKYYFNPYHTPTVYSVELTQDLLDKTEPTEFAISPVFQTTALHPIDR